MVFGLIDRKDIAIVVVRWVEFNNNKYEYF